MEYFTKETLQNNWPIILGTGAALVISGTFIYKQITKRKSKEWPRDTVILHQVGRKTLDLSLTPFGVKLETYFRMAGIPYINNETNVHSSKKKTPWIEYNGEVVADSSFIIDYLNSTFVMDLNMELSEEERAIGRAFCKMVDENTYWTMLLSRWYFDIYEVDPPGLGFVSPWLFPLVRRWVMKQAWQHGMGRHSREEVHHIMDEDLKSISMFLGSKKFMFGDKTCEVDCVMFGELSQFCWHMPNLYGEELVHETYPNLRDYCYRMKKAFWPDLGTDKYSKEKKATS